jgi:hypothetical protein
MEYLMAFVADPYLLGGLLVLFGTGMNGRNNYHEGACNDKEQDDGEWC